MKIMSLGIDPGRSSGGLAWTDGATSAAQAFAKMGKSGDVDRFAPEYFAFLVKLREAYPNHEFRALLEKVWAQPAMEWVKNPLTGKRERQPRKQGAATMFKFGQNFGHLEMGLIGAGIPHRLVIARTWQEPFDLLRKDKRESVTDKKNRHKVEAQRFFKEIKVTHAIADALLIAEHCRRTWGERKS